MDERAPDEFEVRFIEEDEEDESVSEATERRWRRRLLWMVSILWGTLIAAAAAGLMVVLWPRPTQPTAFLLSFVVLAAALSVAGHGIFVVHPHQISEKLKAEYPIPEDQDDDLDDANASLEDESSETGLAND